MSADIELTGSAKLAFLDKIRRLTAVAGARAVALNGLPPSPVHLMPADSAKRIFEAGDAIMVTIKATAPIDGADPEDVKAMLDCLLALGEWAIATRRHEKAGHS